MPSKVLLAEADHNPQQSLAHILSDESIETVCASDGIAAVFLLNETCPHLLIAEIALPRMSGYELCRYVREEPEFQSLPVVLLDSQFNAFKESAAYSVGADAYLSRPFEPGELIGVVRRLLESREETDGEGSASAGPAGVNQQLPLSENYVPEEPDVVSGGRLILTTCQPSEGQTVAAGLPGAVLPQAQDRISILSWAMFAGAIVVTLGFVILEWTLDPSDPAIRKQPSAIEVAEGDTSVKEGQQVGGTLWEQGPGKVNVEGASASEGGATLEPVSRDEGAGVAQAGPPNNSTAATAGPDSEMKRSESELDSPTAVLRKDIGAASNVEPNSPRPRPRGVRSTGSNTAGSHPERSGREMKQGGKRFASWAKDFVKGGGKVVLWAGKRVGGGVKRTGAAFKKIF